MHRFYCFKSFRMGLPLFGEGRRSRLLSVVLPALLFLPMALAPTHPIAVYGYVAATYFPSITRPVYADNGHGLAEFILRPEQIARYEAELFADMADTCSGRLFAIVRDADGTLAHAPVRTWNSFLPAALPSGIRAWLDRKEFPFLGDEVALWLEGRTIVAMGHYHAFGGGPSAGDRLAQKATELPEIVVSNGIVPIVYLRGALVPYGDDVKIANGLYRALRNLERNIMMEVRDIPVNAETPSPGMASFMAYLRDYRDVDIDRPEVVASEVRGMCLDFKAAYAPLFDAGYTAAPYADCPDKLSLIGNLAGLQAWAQINAHPATAGRPVADPAAEIDVNRSFR